MKHLSENLVNTRAYSQIANEYHNKTKNVEMEQEQEQFLKMIPKNGTILDVMCGTGRDSNIMESKGYQVTGVDDVEEMLDISKQEVPKVKFIKQDARKLQLGKTYDGVWCNLGIFMFPKEEIPQVLKNISKHMNQGSALYINFKTGTGQKAAEDPKYKITLFESYFKPEEFKELLKPYFSITKERITTQNNNNYLSRDFVNLFCTKK